MSRVGSVLLVVAAGCSGGSNLPEGWEDALLAQDFEQSECVGTPDDGVERTQTVDVSVRSGGAYVTWTNVLFRCDQALEAYVRRGDSVDVLLQPVDLNPADPARCDCFYDVALSFNVSDTERRLGFYTRRDEVGGPSSPSLVGNLVIE
jgi:hypothetical protein